MRVTARQWSTRAVLLWTLVALAGGIGLTLAAIALGWLDWALPIERVSRFGRFLANPKVELLKDGRFLRLEEDFTYIDPRDKAWVAKKGFVQANGASIPQVFWSIVGGPLEGKYRNASIVHDWGCFEKTESSDDVHRMFYEACLCGGVREKKAKILFVAVYYFGPAWDLNTFSEVRMMTADDGSQHALEVMVTRAETKENAILLSAVDVRKIEQFIESKNPSLDELKNLDISSF